MPATPNPSSDDQSPWRRKRKRGRPERTPEQKEAAPERRIEPSGKGRLKFRPGDPHTLDVQKREARNFSALLAEQISKLQKIQTALNELDDPGVMISKEENALKVFLWEHYKEHKHRDHIAATFLALRRQRLLARLQAAEAALEVAVDLLWPDDTILTELQAAVEHLQREEQRRSQQSKTQPPGSQPEEEAQEASDLQEEELDDLPQINSRHIYSNTSAARARLAEFDKQVGIMRAGMSPAIGWFEEYYVKKTRITAQARQYLKRNEPIPEGVPLLEEVWYGPYLKYRWQETTDGPMYTIQMSLIPEDEIQAAKAWAAILGDESEEEEARNPWPDL